MAREWVECNKIEKYVAKMSAIPINPAWFGLNEAHFSFVYYFSLSF